MNNDIAALFAGIITGYILGMITAFAQIWAHDKKIEREKSCQLYSKMISEIEGAK